MDGQSIAVIIIVAVAVIFMIRKCITSARRGQCSCGCGEDKQQAPCCKSCQTSGSGRPLR
ncbi:hypothetical protein [uncultured Desulfovibrio sp.]|uniref:hypothetical protein n=1 Tax=uncultured Desulfovibrio sp. TaxID=167968 RepID=UPI002618825C|nr:hypothetical protein [uncultured Desulfovibrio sp.]